MKFLTRATFHCFILRDVKLSKIWSLKIPNKSLDWAKRDCQGDIITGELMDKILLTENPNKEQNSTTKVRNLKQVFPRSWSYPGWRLPCFWNSSQWSKVHESSIIPWSAIKKTDFNSDIISIFSKSDKPLSTVSKDSLPGAGSLVKLTKQTGHSGKLLTTETFTVETVEIIKEVMSAWILIFHIS